MPEHEFIIYCIGAEEKNRGKFNYTIPENVIEIKEVFLDSILKEKGAFKKNYVLNQKQKNNIENLILGEKLDFQNLYDLLRSKYVKNVVNFFMSKSFFDIVVSSYEKNIPAYPLLNFFGQLDLCCFPFFI